MTTKDILRFKDSDNNLITPITKVHPGSGVTIINSKDSTDSYEIGEITISANQLDIEGTVRETKVIENTTNDAELTKSAINNNTVATIANIITATNSLTASLTKTFVAAINTAVDGESATTNASTSSLATTKTAIDGVTNAAATFLNAILTAKPTTAVTAAQITQAATDIKAVYNSATTNSGNVRAAARDLIVVYPSGANNTLKSVYDSVAMAVKKTGAAMFNINGLGDNATSGTELKTADIAAIDSITLTSIVIDPSLSTTKIGLDYSLKLKDETLTYNGAYVGNITAKLATMDPYTIFFHKVTIA